MRLFFVIGFMTVFAAASRGEAVFTIPRGVRDPVTAFRTALESVRKNGGGAIRFEKGHYRLKGAVDVALRVSNHNAGDFRPVFLPVTNVSHVVVDGGGSLFEMEAPGIAVLVRDARDVTVKNVAIDWTRPHFTEAVVEGFENGRTRVYVDHNRYPLACRDGVLFATGPGWESQIWCGNVFRRETGEIVPGTKDVYFDGHAESCGNGRWLLSADLSSCGEGARPGDVFVMHVMKQGCVYPGFCADRAKDVVFSNVVVHAAFGKAFLAQRSENVSILGGGVYPRPETGRISSHAADATHFSNVKGLVRIENGRFHAMFDDALNVHSTCLAIEAVDSPRQIRCKYVHPESYGFGVFGGGETVRFIRAATLEDGPEVRLVAAVETDAYHVTLTLAADLPEGIGVGDAVENADYQPSVVFRGNTVSCNRARGILLNTPRSILVESNLFDRVSGCAILLAGDANGWYESGGCRDVCIRHNVFRRCLTSMFQFCEGIVSIYPSMRHLDRQQASYHRNVRIVDNRIETHDAPLLYAQSVDRLVWRNNEIVPNELYRGWGKPRFRTPHCTNVSIGELSVEGESRDPPDVVLTGARAEDAFNRVGSPVPITIRVKNRQVRAAHGVRIAARSLPKAVRVANPGDLAGTVWGLESRAFVVNLEVARPGTYEFVFDVCAAAAQPIPVRVPVTVLPSLNLAKAAYVPKPRPVETDYDIAALYFPGWADIRAWERVLKTCPERKPVLGWFDEGNSECIDWQIKWLVENGIRTLYVDWYWEKDRQIPAPWAKWTDSFAHARYRKYLNWALMWANHGGPGSHSVEDQRAVTKCWIDRYFGTPEYLKVDGKPVVWIWSPESMEKDVPDGGCRRLLEISREMARSAGYPGIYFIAMKWPEGDCSPQVVQRLKDQGFDCTGIYHFMEHGGRCSSNRRYPFSAVADENPNHWRALHKTGILPFLPSLSTGWDDRPWNNGCEVYGKNAADFRRICRAAKDFADETGVRKLCLSPLSEWGEGSYAEPNAEHGFGFYEAVRETFCKRPAAGWPLNYGPKDVGLGPYDLPPSQPETRWTTWDFSHKDALKKWIGLMGVGSGPLEAGPEGVTFTTDSNDPALVCYFPTIEARDCSRVVARMRVIGANDEAQMFWAAPERVVSEEASVRAGVVADGQFHDVVFDLSENPMWRGRISHLRFDPVRHAGVRVTVRSIVIQRRTPRLQSER